MSSNQRTLGIEYGVALRTRDIAACQQLIEAFTVLGTVDAVNGGTQNLHACAGERACQVDSGLTTELNDNAFRFFFVDNIENILYSQRLKVQFIGNIEVSGNGFRVVVDDNGS